MTVPKMPEEYKGETTKSGGYTKTAPRKWTDNEIKWVMQLNEQGFTNKEIAESIDRTEVSTQIKIKRIGKKQNNYNAEHIDEKYQTNIEFLNYIHPTSVLDVYAGKKSFYKDCDMRVTDNDKNEECETEYHLDALQFCCYIYSNAKINNTFDIVDLDPFGSAYDCFDLAIKMAKKGLIITFGEMGHKRWKRLDYVGRHYGIESLQDFTLDRLIEHVQMIGRRNKKQLDVFAAKEWRNIGRVWFEVSPLKITEQWEKKEVSNYEMRTYL